MPDWISRYLPEGWGTGQFVLAVFLLTAGTVVVSLLISAVVVVRLPHDYFTCRDRQGVCARQHPFLRWPLVILKNLFGLLLVLLGVALSLPGVPGQGILTILMGAMLVDFPGKRRAELWLLRRRGVLNTVNRLRARFGRRPLELDSPPPAA